MSIVCLNKVYHRFCNNYVIKDISLSVENGERILLLGANGAGKSTLLKIIAGIIKPSQGEITCRTSCYNYSGHEDLLYGALTVEENLNFFSSLLSISPEPIIQYLGLQKLLSILVRNLSKGQKTLVGIARALLNRPELLILDEPTAALDDNTSCKLLAALQDLLSPSAAIIIATHDIARLQTFGGRFIFLNSGTVYRDSVCEQDSGLLEKDQEINQKKCINYSVY